MIFSATLICKAKLSIILVYSFPIDQEAWRPGCSPYTRPPIVLSVKRCIMQMMKPSGAYAPGKAGPSAPGPVLFLLTRKRPQRNVTVSRRHQDCGRQPGVTSSGAFNPGLAIIKGPGAAFSRCGALPLSGSIIS